MVALVFGLVLACYWPALHGGLVWDDDGHVTRPDLRSWAGLGRIWFDVRATQQYYPVLHSSFWIEHRLWGDATLGYHLINVLLHALSCCLLALILQRLLGARRAQPPDRLEALSLSNGQACAPTGRIDGNAAGRGAGLLRPPLASSYVGAAWLAALIFAVHPVCVESVAWISEQKNTLALVFYLLAALAYLDFAVRRRRWSYGLALVLFALALGTKSVTATLPVAILVVLWWRNGRLSWQRDVGPLIPWFFLSMAAGLLTVWVERNVIGAEGARFDLSAGQRLLLAGRVIWFYLGKLAWPTDLMFIYPRWNAPAEAAGWYGWLVAASAITVVLWLARRRTRGPLAGWLFFVGSLFPALGFFNVYPFIYSYVADHFQYLASLGIIVSVAVGLAMVLAGAPAWIRTSGRLLCALLVLTLAILSNRQSRMYRDAETLYRETLKRNPACWMAHNNLAFGLATSPAGKAEAMAHYREALRIKPDYAEAHNNLAIELAKLPDRLPEAIEHYQQALRILPSFAEAHNNLALALAELPGRRQEALAHYEQAVQLKPTYAEAHCNLANTLAKQPDRLPEALAHYEEALRLKPDYAEAHNNLALALVRLPGRRPEALAHFEQALRLQPDLVEAHVNLAHELARLPGRRPEALAHFEQALRLQPGRAEVHVYLAYELAQQADRLPEARAHFEEAVRLKPDYVEAHNGLGIVLARQGRLEEARAHWERALELNPDYGDARRNLDLLNGRPAQ
jgi:protein O-mannosyl-transferase